LATWWRGENESIRRRAMIEATYYLQDRVGEREVIEMVSIGKRGG